MKALLLEKIGLWLSVIKMKVSKQEKKNRKNIIKI